MVASRRDIGQYVGAELIGQGGFSAVYRAVDPRHGREVAIKVIQGAMGETERRRFDRERQAMGRLGGHPHIVTVYDSGYTPEGEAYLVMELAAHGSLGDRLRATGPLRWAEAVPLVATMAAALQAAHDDGVLHRDVKPDNILIDRYGSPKLSDFGIAMVAGNATATTSTTATLAHAAPELLNGQAPTAAMDIYALGSTLHTLLSGMPPFQRPGEESVGPLVTRTLTEPPPDLRPLGVPDAVAAVVERALAKAPEHRQATAAALAAELNSAAAVAAAADAGATVASAGENGAAATQWLGSPAGVDPSAGPPSGGGYSPGGAADYAPPRFDLQGAGAGPGPGPRSPLLLVGAAVAGAVVLAVIVIAALSASGGGDDNADDTTTVSTTVSVTTTTAPITTTTTRPTTTTTAPTTTTIAVPTVSIDCPATFPMNVRTECAINSTNAVQGEYVIPGFFSETVQMDTVPGSNGIFLTPTNSGAVGQSFTITATVTDAAGRQATAQHTFVIGN